jgi:chitinase
MDWKHVCHPVYTIHIWSVYIILLISHFSPAVSNDLNRHIFVDNIVNAYNLYNLDGIDIDWEYPGQQGNSGNHVSSSDTAKFLSFLQLLREKLPTAAKITAATQTLPFAGEDGNPLADVTEFAKVLDWVLLMNYDTWGCDLSILFSLT